MRKKFLVAVATAGCISRFRNGQQFTKTPKEIWVDDNELATLQADSYLSVNVIPNDDVNTTGNGADDENATQDVVLDKEDVAMAPEAVTDRIAITPDMASDDGTIVADTAKTEADAGVSPITLDAVEADETESADVPQEPVVDLNTVIQSMRGLNLDLTANKPTVRELKALGLDVSAKERDDAWDGYLIAQKNKGED